jgi:hypothetical protein
MNQLIKTISIVACFPVLACSSTAQNEIVAPIAIQTIRLEHTNPSLGPYEEVRTFRLECNEKHKETVHTFLTTSEINHTVKLYEYLKAIQEKDQKLIEKTVKNKPNNKFNQGEPISNLTFTFKDGSSVELSDVYRNYHLTHFNPNFTKYLVKHGSLTTNKSNDDLKIMHTTDYKDTDLVIKVQLTPGGPGSDDYELSILGNGTYTYNSEIGSIPQTSVHEILKKAEAIHFKDITANNQPLSFVHDGQQTNVAIWSDGYLKQGEFGYGNPMPESVQNLVDLILTKTGKTRNGFHAPAPSSLFEEINYTDSDVIIKITRTKGGPNSMHQNLSILGDGTCITTIYGPGNKKRLSKEELNEIFEKAKKAGIFNEEELTDFPKKQKTQIIHDGPSTSISLWNNGTLKKEMSGHGHSMTPGTMEIINYIFHLLEYDYKPSDVILELQLTPGDPDSEDYQLTLYGDGHYKFSSSKESQTLLNQSSGTISIDTKVKIFHKINQEQFRRLVYQNSLKEIIANDEQNAIVSYWNNGSLKQEVFNVNGVIPQELTEVINFIFETIKAQN